jgi:DNA-binding CsgD family transcriptional regulator
MRHSPGFYKRLSVMLIASDLGRAAIALLIMGVLALADLPLWLVLLLPVLVYAGLWLITSTGPLDQFRPLDKKGDFKACIALRQCLLLHADQVGDVEASKQLKEIITRLDRILGAIEEDEKYDSTTPLLSLLGITNDLLEKYLKVTRRGFDDARTHEAVRQSLGTLSASYREFWEQLNRYVIVDLDALNQTIRELLEKLASPQDAAGGDEEPIKRPTKPESIVGSEGEKVFGSGLSVNGYGKNELLTRREREVLCLLAKPRTNREISDELYIATRTVEKHVENICTKLEVDSRTAAIIYALNHGLCIDDQPGGASHHAN